MSHVTSPVQSHLPPSAKWLSHAMCEDRDKERNPVKALASGLAWMGTEEEKEAALSRHSNPLGRPDQGGKCFLSPGRVNEHKHRRLRAAAVTGSG